MLKEFKRVRQEPGEYRRWFSDPAFDLVVWYDVDRLAVKGFQLLYRLQTLGEAAFTWRQGAGCSHNRIDTGSRLFNPSPILTRQNAAPISWLRQLFRTRADGLEEGIRELVEEKLNTYCESETMPMRAENY